eukprot:TRINITY_DN14549_c0_g2_i14.p1 TRINITY_DN14549_c0_g2~~TRINITY_DN14549_c0_g2_i14.p1  ORF type:complete len:319 (-),score=59.13 TRINITY_DN14549_c0_g2_i14:179-1135(-)
MGNCCILRDEVIYLNPLPGEPLSPCFRRFLSEHKFHLRLQEMADEYLNGEYDVMDVTLFLLSLSSDELAGHYRICLLKLLLGLILVPSGLQKFNSTYGNLTRLSRLRILLLEVNEETEEGRNLLEMLGYFSVLFEKISAGWSIRYTIILDKSGSMTYSDGFGMRWADAKEACEHMADAMESLAINGMTMYLFSESQSSHPKYTGLTCSRDIQRIFESNNPAGGTDMSGVLRQALNDHFVHREQEHILVITDGEPNNRDDVVRTLVEGINKLALPDELGITFMQVGHDREAAQFLHELQDCLTEKGARWNVVECITYEK